MQMSSGFKGPQLHQSTLRFYSFFKFNKWQKNPSDPRLSLLSSVWRNESIKALMKLPAVLCVRCDLWWFTHSVEQDVCLKNQRVWWTSRPKQMSRSSTLKRTSFKHDGAAEEIRKAFSVFTDSAVRRPTETSGTNPQLQISVSGSGK